MKMGSIRVLGPSQNLTLTQKTNPNPNSKLTYKLNHKYTTLPPKKK